MYVVILEGQMRGRGPGKGFESLRELDSTLFYFALLLLLLFV